MGTHTTVDGNHLSALPYPIRLVVKPTIVTPNSLVDILAMRLYPERVVACSVLYIQHISVASSVCLPLGVHTLSSTRLILSQWRGCAWCSILGVYPCKVAWSGGVEYHVQRIEVYVFVLSHLNILQYSMHYPLCQMI
jgi:hypothetical protein